MSRTKQYEPGEVVEKAMYIFWREGYGATSIENLAKATGLSRSSLYSEYGSKRELFSLVIGHYLDHFVTRLLPTATEGLDAVEELIGRLANDGHPGCLMVNGITELSTTDPYFTRDFERFREKIWKGFHQALQAAETTGEIEPNTAPRRSEFLTTQLLGLLVTQRGLPRSAELRASTDALLAEVSSWRRLSFRRRLKQKDPASQS